MTREGLPKEMMYPVSVRELREALGSLIETKSVQSRFRRPPTATAEYRKLVETAAPLPTLAGHYRNWSAWQEPASRPRKASYLEDEWWVEVYGVPRNCRKVCHDALLRDGLTIIKKWLEEPRSSFWLESPPHMAPWLSKTCAVLIDPRTGSIDIAEQD
jgi:hypothetical protein